jgi:hypothetical protein
MRGVILVVLLLLVLALAACGGSPVSDARAVETQVAARIFATQTASVPTPTDTPQLITTPEADTSIPPRGTYVHHFKITETFDRFSGLTNVLLLALQYPGMGRANLAVTYLYEGSTPYAPTLVGFMLAYESASWTYADCHDLTLLLDGRIRLLPRTEYSGKVQDDGSVAENITSRLPVNEFLQIVNAKKVEGKLCNSEFVLTDEQMEALRDVASRMQPRNFTPIK